MTAVLGIDAAWTVSQPSGVALIQRYGARWRCLAVAHSYAAFIQSARDESSTLTSTLPATPSLLGELIQSARALSGDELDVVAIDMPIATVEITGRRAADTEVSRRFGAQGCSTHSPSSIRPGQLGAGISEVFMQAGFGLATATTQPGVPRQLVEVYPHPALLALLGRSQRVPYKISKSHKYWPGASRALRIERLLAEFDSILSGLAAHIDGISLRVPRAGEVESLHSLKPIEDAIDALVCCWVGCRYLEGAAYPLGDATAAIWCPAS